MTKKQRNIIIRFIIIMALTAAAVVVQLYVKDMINRSEAMKVMERMGGDFLEFRQANFSLPPQSTVDEMLAGLKGYVRGTGITYRGNWVKAYGDPNQVLAYSFTRCPHSPLSDGYTVLRLSGKVEWMSPGTFKTLLAGQQTAAELDMLEKQQAAPPPVVQP